jgi:type VI secretion system secreted protein VgrG
MLKLRYLRILIFLTVLLAIASGPSSVDAVGQPMLGGLPSLGTAENFAVLAGSTATNTGSTIVTGDLGVWPGSEVTGFPPGIVNGTIYPGGAVAQQAQSDVTVAYNDVAGRACNVDLSGTDLGGLTLTEAVYCFSSSAQLTGQLVLDAEGNADALFIFQIGSMLTTASNSSVLVINNGTECNVYWQVGSSATLGTSTAFAGNILALTSITLNTGADVSGRSLARNGAVTMDSNDISAADCTETPTNVSLSNFGNDSPGINIGLGLLFLVSFLAIAFWSWRNHQTYPPTGGVK